MGPDLPPASRCLPVSGEEPRGSLRGRPLPRTNADPMVSSVLHMSSALLYNPDAGVSVKTLMTNPASVCGEASFQILILPFFLSTSVICSILEKYLLETTFSHLKNTEKKCQILFSLCSLRTSKTAKRKFYKIRKNMC